MSQPTRYQAAGELLASREEYTIANWSGATLDKTFETYDDARNTVASMVEEAQKQGFTKSAQSLQILRRDVSEIAGDWRPLG